MRIYRITTRHSQLVDVSTPHTPTDVQGIGTNVNIPVWAYTQIIQGTWNISGSKSTDNFSGYLYSNGLNNEIHYKVYLSTGTWKLIFLVMKNSDECIATIYLNNSDIATFDFYASSIVRIAILSQDNISINTDGLYTLKIKITDKNASSSDYNLRIYGICFMRTA